MSRFRIEPQHAERSKPTPSKMPSVSLWHVVQWRSRTQVVRLISSIALLHWLDTSPSFHPESNSVNIGDVESMVRPHFKNSDVN